ncbi:MAG TPA: YkgJ family cysteine cluster protein [Phycisphaerales bacterium]|nr:YkgJ family cysteine cluster protein [Phycisphaerales bacterium]
MGGTTTIPVELTVFGGTLRAGIPVPSESVALGDMLPVFQAVTEAVIHLSVKAAESQGKSVSCRAGCGACCRQFVPISPTEAAHLIRLVESMPEPRRSIVKQRFAEAAAALNAGGLKEPLLAPHLQPRERRRTIGLEYFALRIPCPFLEDESCSIHPDRPLICREYLVTSPAERCTTLEDIDGVKLPHRPSLALSQMSEQPGDALIPTVPLTLIFEWAKTAPVAAPPRPGPQQMQQFLDNLTRTPAS